MCTHNICLLEFRIKNTRRSSSYCMLAYTNQTQNITAKQLLILLRQLVLLGFFQNPIFSFVLGSNQLHPICMQRANSLVLLSLSIYLVCIFCNAECAGFVMLMLKLEAAEQEDALRKGGKIMRKSKIVFWTIFSIFTCIHFLLSRRRERAEHFEEKNWETSSCPATICGGGVWYAYG